MSLLLGFLIPTLSSSIFFSVWFRHQFSLMWLWFVLRHLARLSPCRNSLSLASFLSHSSSLTHTYTHCSQPCFSQRLFLSTHASPLSYTRFYHPVILHLLFFLLSVSTPMCPSCVAPSFCFPSLHLSTHFALTHC